MPRFAVCAARLADRRQAAAATGTRRGLPAALQQALVWLEAVGELGSAGNRAVLSRRGGRPVPRLSHQSTARKRPVFPRGTTGFANCPRQPVRAAVDLAAGLRISVWHAGHAALPLAGRGRIAQPLGAVRAMACGPAHERADARCLAGHRRHRESVGRHRLLAGQSAPPGDCDRSGGELSYSASSPDNAADGDRMGAAPGAAGAGAGSHLPDWQQPGMPPRGGAVLAALQCAAMGRGLGQHRPAAARLAEAAAVCGVAGRLCTGRSSERGPPRASACPAVRGRCASPARRADSSAAAGANADPAIGRRTGE